MVAASANPNAHFDDVLQTVEDRFDRRTAFVVEAVLSTKATLLLEGIKDCAGLVVVGPSGSGKTTAVNLLRGATYQGEALFYWSDDVTPAAFVSHDASLNEDQLAEVDLLPKIRHRTLINADMASWFSGSYENIYSMMSTLARVMDGEGYKKDSGAQGSRGYEGDYRFALIGATTPLDKQAWDAMGHVGNRVVFHQMPAKDSREEVVSDVISGEEYGTAINQARSEVANFLSEIWESYGGYNSFCWDDQTDSEASETIGYLAQLVAYCRAPRRGPREAMPRIVAHIWNLARGHALLCGREQVKMEDLGVCARVALSTMHRKRRGIVRAVVDPATPDQITAKDLRDHDATASTRKTLRKRMQLLADLDLGEVTTANTDRGTRSLLLRDEFCWPEYLDFPSFE